MEQIIGVNGQEEKANVPLKIESKPEGEKKRAIRYEVIRPHIKDGDVLMFRGEYMISAIIKLLTHSSYSHAGIVAWWNKRLMIMQATPKGVVVSRLSSLLDKYKGEVEWYAYREEISEENRKKMIDFAQEELGKSFARWKALLFGWRVFFKKSLGEKDEFRRSNKLFCSHYVAEIYTHIGIDLKKKREDRFMSPQDIADSMEKKGIFITRKRIFLQPDEGKLIKIE